MRDSESASLELLSRACKQASIARSSAYALAKQGKFPQLLPVGGRTYVDRRELDQWLEARIVAGRNAAPRDSKKFTELAKRSVAARKAKRQTQQQLSEAA